MVKLSISYFSGTDLTDRRFIAGACANGDQTNMLTYFTILASTPPRA